MAPWQVYASGMGRSESVVPLNAQHDRSCPESRLQRLALECREACHDNEHLDTRDVLEGWPLVVAGVGLRSCAVHR